MWPRRGLRNLPRAAAAAADPPGAHATLRGGRPESHGRRSPGDRSTETLPLDALGRAPAGRADSPGNTLRHLRSGTGRGPGAAPRAQGRFARLPQRLRSGRSPPRRSRPRAAQRASLPTCPGRRPLAGTDREAHGNNGGMPAGDRAGQAAGSANPCPTPSRRASQHARPARSTGGTQDRETGRQTPASEGAPEAASRLARTDRDGRFRR